MKLSDYVIGFIAKRGVSHVFFLPGGGAMHLNDSLGKCGAIQPVCNLHEQACAMAAEAYARVTNNLGVALVTTGPAATNTVTGVVGAYQDSTPCLFISGQVKRPDLVGDSGLRQRGVQEVDIVSIVKSVTKYAVTVMDPQTIRYHLEKAVWLATTGRRGPVWLDIPLDVQGATIEPNEIEGFVPDVQDDCREEFQQLLPVILECLANSQRPVILAGNGIHLAGAEADFQKLVEVLGIPVLTTWLGQDLLSAAHPLLCGRPGPLASRAANFAVQNSDVLLSLGSRIDLGLVGYAPQNFARHAKKIVVDIDPAELHKNKDFIDYPVLSDVGVFIRDLTEAAINSSSLPPFHAENWRSRCKDWQARYPIVGDEHRSVKNRCSTYVLCEELSSVCDSDDLLVLTSSGAAIGVFFMGFEAKLGQRIFHNRGTGGMGFAIPASIGACLASGGRRTICIDADGSFQMNIQELETIRRMNLPIKIFVLNNDGYGSIRNSQTRHFGRMIGADSTSGLTLPDTLAIANAYQLPTDRIHDHNGLRERLQAILGRPGPFVCDVLIPENETYYPSLSSIRKEDGRMVSRPLEDLWPFLDRDEFLENMLVPVVPE